ncbi:hypothetical protein HYH02_010411 [Chlamydomonas schloesseri]|uniref:Uncharacterized protein n=1 Tax=Chlamydomonas schloesseri TaxID=2026947 RepID=A0A835W7R7_9CHLO|nr:hypothetical protein HYH02_010411 [Chlamydomonas schloesseri]|eukprot:KAG2440533.1 hypothetical protein HYH02_010411 [Chlamydomonas schloesseri]
MGRDAHGARRASSAASDGNALAGGPGSSAAINGARELGRGTAAAAATAAAGSPWEPAVVRTAAQQHVPPSPASTSTSAPTASLNGRAGGMGGRGGPRLVHGSPRVAHAHVPREGSQQGRQQQQQQQPEQPQGQRQQPSHCHPSARGRSGGTLQPGILDSPTHSGGSGAAAAAAAGRAPLPGDVPSISLNAGAHNWPSSSSVVDSALQAKIDAATNWYELRAVLASSGGSSSRQHQAAGSLPSPAAAATVLAVLRRLVAVTRYDMRPAECAALGAFLERWLLETALLALPAMRAGDQAAALHAVAKLARALPSPPPAWVAGWFAAAAPHLRAAAFRPKDLSLSLWALSRLQGVRPPAGGLQLLLAAAEPHLHRFNAQDLSLVALALAALTGRSDSSNGSGGSSGGGGSSSSHGSSAGSGGGSGNGNGGGAVAELEQLLPSCEWRQLYLARVSELVRQEAAGSSLGGGSSSSGNGSSSSSSSSSGAGWARGGGRGSECGPQALCNLLHGLVRSGLLSAPPEVGGGPASRAAGPSPAAAAAAAAPDWLDADTDDFGLLALTSAAAAGGLGGTQPAAAAATAAPLPSATLAAAVDTRWLLEDLCTALYRQLPQCTPQGLTNVLSALAAAGHVPEEGWVERFLTESAARMDTGHGSGGSSSSSGEVVDVSGSSASSGGGVDGGGSRWCNADDLAHLAAAAAQLRLAPPRWWTSRLYGAMERRLMYGVGGAGGGACSARQLSQMLHGAAQLQRSYTHSLPDGACLGVATSSVSSSTSTTTTIYDAATASSSDQQRLPAAAADPALAAALSATAVRPPPSLLAAWHRAAAAALPNFNAVDAAHALWALAALGERPPQDWLQRLLVGVRGTLAAAPPCELAVLLWSLAELRFRPTWSWIADCVEASGPGLARMEGQDYAMLLSGLVRLGGRPTPEWSVRLLAALAPRLRRLQLRALSQCVWALYRLRVQPPPELLSQLGDELRLRWLRQAAGTADAEAAEAQADTAGGAEEQREQLRHSAMLLWVVSTWLGAHGRRRRLAATGSRCGVQASVLGARAGAPRLRLRRAVNGSGAPASPDAVVAAAPPSAVAASAPGASSSAPACRLSSRMLRRRRAARPGNLVSSLGGDAAAAAALRRSVAAQLLPAALAATEPLLAARRATAQDAALLAAVVRRMPVQVRGAAAEAAPAWPRALLEAAAPLLPSMTIGGLLQTLAAARVLMRSSRRSGGEQPGSGLVDGRWVAAAEHAVAAHLTSASPPLPCAARVTLLHRLAALSGSVTLGPVNAAAPCTSTSTAGTSSSGRGRGSASTSAGADAGPAQGGGGSRLLLDAVAAMRRASSIAEPLVALQATLLRSRVRLRKLRAALQAAHAAATARRARGPPPAAAAALAAAAREVAAGVELAAAAAAGSRSACRPAALAAARWRVHGAVSAAARALDRRGSLGDEEDGDEEEVVEATGHHRKPRQPLPPLSAEQRRWIQARAQRQVAAQLLTAAPPEAVAQLVALAAAPLAAEAGRSPVPAIPDERGEEAGRCLLWLAAACGARWRHMQPQHRALAARAWRAALAALEARSSPLAQPLAMALPSAVPGGMDGGVDAVGPANGSHGKRVARAVALAPTDAGLLVPAAGAAAAQRR